MKYAVYTSQICAVPSEYIGKRVAFKVRNWRVAVWAGDMLVYLPRSVFAMAFKKWRIKN